MVGAVSNLVYLLCFLASALCAGLLLRQYRTIASPILLWSCACFTLLAISNLLVVIDKVLLPELDLKLARLLMTLIAVTVLLVGFIWEAEQD